MLEHTAQLVELIARDIWRYNECAWDFDDPPPGMAQLQKQIAIDRAEGIVTAISGGDQRRGEEIAQFITVPRKEGRSEPLHEHIKRRIAAIPATRGGYISVCPETLRNVLSRDLLDKIAREAAEAAKEHNTQHLLAASDQIADRTTRQPNPTPPPDHGSIIDKNI